MDQFYTKIDLIIHMYMPISDPYFNKNDNNNNNNNNRLSFEAVTHNLHSMRPYMVQ